MDLSPDEGEQAVLWVTAEMAADSRGDLVYRDGVRWETGLRPAAAEEPEPAVIRSLEEPVELKRGGKGRLDSLGFAPA